MNRRKDYEEFKHILEKYHISRFYHFTDRDNIESIIENGGLFSYGDCIKRGIRINRPGGSELSHELDYKENLQDYVRVSICKKHPMMYTAIKDERIVNPVILEIDTDVLFIDGNIFSDKNAVRGDSNKGTDFVDFNRIHFNTVIQRSQFDVDEDEQEYYQAEILVPHHIPLHYILNISDFQVKESEKEITRIKQPYSSIITEENPVAVFLILNQSYPTEELITFEDKKMSKAQAEGIIVDQVINELIVRNTSNGIIDDKYQLAVVGYGDYAYNCFEKKNVQSLKELNDNPLFVKTITKEIKTRHGIKRIETKQPVWVKPQSDGGAYLNKALDRVKDMVDIWIEKHPISFPPVIIHITEYRYHGAEDSDMIQLAREMKSLFTNDGNALFFNIIIAGKEDSVSVVFPSSKREIGKSHYGEVYYLMSSTLPSTYNPIIPLTNDKEALCQKVGIAFNVKLKDLFGTFLSIIPQ